MGMTKTFYFIKKDEYTAEEIEKKVKELSACRVYFSQELKWLPIYSLNVCEGCDHANKGFMQNLQEIFGKPILSFSVFDSDFLSTAICKDGGIYRYACMASDIAEDFMAIDEYSEELPEFLCDYGIEYEQLEEIWEDEEVVFEEDRLGELVKLLGTILVCDEDEAMEHVQPISSEA